MTLKNILIKAFYSFFIIISLIFSSSSFSQIFEPNIIIAKIKPEHLSFISQKQNFSSLGIEIKEAVCITNTNLKEGSSIQNIYRIKLSNMNQVRNTCDKLNKTGFFEYCQPNYVDQILYSPSDIKIGNQYTLATVKAFEAWDLDQGDSSIVIGVTDTGIDFNHEDLRTNIAFNLNDPIDGIDNDFDGYIDNFRGWDFGCDDNNPQWDESGTSGNLLHGVFTAGFAGARTDNNIGMASIGFSNKILPIKISDNNGTIYRGYESIIYAAEHGCKIINCSWGSTTPTDFGRDVIKYVTEELNVIVVAAAGNENNEKLYYPASYDHVISVAASNNEDYKWANSSFNWRVDISAPGQNVYSTFPNSTYGTSSGTSFSSPIVASSIALLKSYLSDTLSNEQLLEILKSNSDYIDTIGSNFNYHNKLGKGRLNIFKALQNQNNYAINSSDFKFLKNGVPPNPNDTAEFSFIVNNHLSSIQNLQVTIQTNSEYIELLDSTFTIPLLTENDSINASQFHIQLIVNADIPNNEELFFTIKYNSNEYNTEEIRTLTYNLKSIEFNKNRIHTTFFPEGKVAYNYNSDGFGLQLDLQESVLYEMGIIAGYSTDKVVSNVRSHYDFNTSQNFDSTTVENRWTAKNTISNSDSIPLSIGISYESFNDSHYQNLIFIHYNIINTSAIDYNEFYFGLFSDWDLFHYLNNYTTIDSTLKLAMTHCYGKTETVAMQFLNHSNWNRYAIDNNASTGNVITINGLSNSEMYEALSNDNYYVGLENSGTDILDILSSGPYELLSNDTLKLTFAVIADSSISQVLSAASIAQNLYDSLYYGSNGITEIKIKKLFEIYPNPTSNHLFVKFFKKTASANIVEIYNLEGQLVKQQKITQNIIEIDVSKFSKGLYLVKVGNYSQKVLIE